MLCQAGDAQQAATLSLAGVQRLTPGQDGVEVELVTGLQVLVGLPEVVAAGVYEDEQHSELTVIHLGMNLCELFEAATQRSSGWSRHANNHNHRPGDCVCEECPACVCTGSLLSFLQQSCTLD